MIDDIERRLRRIAPPGAPPELRARVLAAVAGELHAISPGSSANATAADPSPHPSPRCAGRGRPPDPAAMAPPLGGGDHRLLLPPGEKVPEGRMRGPGGGRRRGVSISPRRISRPSLAVAAAVFAGLGLNAWVNDRLELRLSAVLGPAPVRREAAELADDIAAITDPATGRWAYQQLAAGRADPDDSRRSAARLRRAIRQLTADFEVNADEAPQESPQSDRDRRGSLGRPPADRQCRLRLVHGVTA